MSSEAQRTSKTAWLFLSLSRGLAAFIALYSLLSLSFAVVLGSYNQNAWWIDLSFLPQPFSALIQLALTLALACFAVHVPRHLALRIALALPVLVGFITALINAIDTYMAAVEGLIILGFPLPFSLFISVGLLCIIMSILFGTSYVPQSDKPGKVSTGLTIAAAFLVTALLFPLGQMHCFGTTDYRVPVDAAVVLGARVYPDGTPSPVLQDRLDTAIQFYEEGYTPLLVMSGGIDADGLSEAEAMKDYALERGVPEENIIIDEQGSNTKRTAANTVETLRSLGLEKVATVSNFYHLARIKMLYLAEGIDVATVPSVPHKDGGYPLLNVIREIPGWWYYWFLNLVE